MGFETMAVVTNALDLRKSQCCTRPLCMLLREYVSVAPISMAFSSTIPRTVSNYANPIGRSKSLELSDTSQYEHNKGNRSWQTIKAMAFLDLYEQLHSIPCPTGHGSTGEESVRYLSSSTTVEVVYNHYIFCWDDTRAGALQRSAKAQDKPLVKKIFQRVWRERVPCFASSEQEVTFLTPAQRLTMTLPPRKQQRPRIVCPLLALCTMQLQSVSLNTISK